MLLNYEPHTAMTALSTEQPTWCSVNMQMRDISTRQNPAEEQGCTSTSWKTIQFHTSATQSWQSQPSSSLSWSQLLRLNLLHFLLLPAKWCPTGKPISTWVGHNHTAPSRPIILWQLRLQTQHPFQKGPKWWTWDCGGCDVMAHKSGFEFNWDTGSKKLVG